MENSQKCEISLDNPVLLKLIRNSHLTKNQVESLLIWKIRKEKGLKITKSSKKVERFHKTVSKGSFYRTLAQAKKNIKRSVITLLTLVALDVTDAESIEKMLQITGIFQRELIRLNESIIEKIIEDLDKI